LPPQGSEVKIFQVSATLYLRDVKLIIVSLMRAFDKSLILFLALGNVHQLRLKWGEHVAGSGTLTYPPIYPQTPRRYPSEGLSYAPGQNFAESKSDSA